MQSVPTRTAPRAHQHRTQTKPPPAAKPPAPPHHAPAPMSAPRLGRRSSNGQFTVSAPRRQTASAAPPHHAPPPNQTRFPVGRRSSNGQFTLSARFWPSSLSLNHLVLARSGPPYVRPSAFARWAAAHPTANSTSPPRHPSSPRQTVPRRPALDHPTPRSLAGLVPLRPIQGRRNHGTDRPFPIPARTARLSRNDEMSTTANLQPVAPDHA